MVKCSKNSLISDSRNNFKSKDERLLTNIQNSYKVNNNESEILTFAEVYKEPKKYLSMEHF